jgi:hypothetical protein
MSTELNDPGFEPRGSLPVPTPQPESEAEARLIDMRRFDAARSAAAWWVEAAAPAFPTKEARAAFERDLNELIAHELAKKSVLMLTSLGGPQQPLRRIAERHRAILKKAYWPKIVMMIWANCVEINGPEGKEVVWHDNVLPR